jgi:subtilisin family serine protease
MKQVMARTLMAIVVLVLASTAAASGPAMKGGFRLLALQNEDNSSYWRGTIPGIVAVRFRNDVDISSSGLNEWLAANGATVVRQHSGPFVNFVAAALADSTKQGVLRFIRTMVQDERVLYAEPSMRGEPAYVPNDPLWPWQWGPYWINADMAWDSLFGSWNTSVAVVDQGIYYYHPDLFNVWPGYDFVDMDSVPLPADSTEAHGTHVSGTIGATIDNETGIAGVSQSYLLSVRVLPSQTGVELAQGIAWSAMRGVRVVNMSVKWGDMQLNREVCESAYAYNVLLIAASGNDAQDSVYYPAAYPSVIAVGALDTTGFLAGFSNWGVKQELVAPGVWIWSTVPWEGYAVMNGTSMACPHVSGVAALMFSKYPELSNAEARSLLSLTATDLGEPGWDTVYGWGLVDAFAAMNSVGVAELPSQVRASGPAVSLWPNPARDRATVRYSLPSDSRVSISIYDASGRLVRSLYEGVSKAGGYVLRWDGTATDGRTSPNGIHFCRLTTEAVSQSVKFTLTR